MVIQRLGGYALALTAAAALLVACTGKEASNPGQPTPAVGSGAPTSAKSANPTSTAATKPTSTAAPTRSDQPVPKVQRSGGPASPTVTAKPAKVDGTVRYSDGLSLKVVSVDFAKETKPGPGRFPGRQYAVLRLQVVNHSKRNLSMQTVVVTVLDKHDVPVPPVSAVEAKVSDFAGVLKAGKKASARYAFAVPASSRSKVTVVVDFDGAHTSAVFRGKLT